MFVWTVVRELTRLQLLLEESCGNCDRVDFLHGYEYAVSLAYWVMCVLKADSSCHTGTFVGAG